MSTLGIYVHVPFCSALCPYCDFAVVVGRADRHAAYLDAVVREARAEAWPVPEATVFVGGGTPTFVDPALLARALRDVIAAAGDPRVTEFSVEANPDSVDAGKLAILRDAGVDRVSIGAQSFDDDVLRALGRTHDARAIAQAVDAARAAGIDNVSLDLIYGAPGESDASWERSLKEALALEPRHLSCYALTIEDRTPFGTAVAAGKMRAPDDDALVRRFEIACDVLEARGYVHYEISNWAKPGYESAHNIVYWSQGDYLGLGLGAHSHRAGTRWSNTRALNRYIDDPTRHDVQTLTERERAEEWVSLRMRLLTPVPVAQIEARIGPIDTALLEEAALVERDGATLSLTRRGMMLENEVTARLLEPRNRDGARAV